jgi:hypothetical protein
MVRIASGGDLLTRGIRWSARTISLIIISFSLFMLISSALIDDSPADAGIIIFVMILIPTSLALVFAWGHEKHGGLIAVIGSIGLMVSVFFAAGHNRLQTSLLISSPFLISGLLFLLAWRRLTTALEW